MFALQPSGTGTRMVGARSATDTAVHEVSIRADLVQTSAVPMTRQSAVRKLAHDNGLILNDASSLTIRRERRGDAFRFRDASGKAIRDKDEIKRLNSLAVPPAYEEARYSADPRTHLQAVGTDAAGRLQYRYHKEWPAVREALKVRRLANIASSLPDIEIEVGKRLASKKDDLAFTAAAVVELVAHTALRAGSESYARDNGTRGATTLLKSNVSIVEGKLRLRFKAKGGKKVEKEVAGKRLVKAITRLLALPGRRLFQFRNDEGKLKRVHAGDVNRVLKSITGRPLSLKDFRTLVASACVLEKLVAIERADTVHARKAQVSEAIAAAAEDLANTPTVCKASYVCGAVVAAFENGDLPRVKPVSPVAHWPIAHADALAKIVRRRAA